MKYFIIASSLILLSLVTTSRAELVDVTLKGTLAQTVSYSVTRDTLSAVELEYINSFDIGSTFEFTFRFDSSSQPTSTGVNPLSPVDEYATYTNGVSLQNGRVGTFTNFKDWKSELTVYALWRYGGYNVVQFELTDPNSGRVADLQFNWSILGAINGRQVFSPSILPNAKTLDGVVQRYDAQFGVRYSEFRELIYLKGTEDIERIAAVAVVPEPTSAVLCLSALVAAVRWRRRV
jgi:hypothetical protein